MPLRETAIPFTPYLRKKGTDEIFAYGAGIAMREDMEPYEGIIPIPKAIATVELSKNEKILEMRKEGKSLADIGRVLGISKVAVFKRLQRIAIKKSEALTSNMGLNHYSFRKP